MLTNQIVLLSLFAASFLFAQTAGNPIQTVGKREWTMGLTGNYQNQQMGNVMAVSKRVLVKSAWGVEEWLNVYGLLGTVQLSMNRKLSGVQDYKDRSRLGYGAGFHWQFDLNREEENPIGLFGSMTVLKFVSEGTFKKSKQSQTGATTDEFAFKYDWGEMMVCGGLIIPIRTVRIYGGGAGWAIRRMDTKKQYSVDNANVKRYIGELKGEYQSGIWTGGIVGIEFVLPQRYSISVEGLVFNKQNYQIMIGICQTGRPE